MTTTTEWLDRPTHEGLWWRKRRGDIIADVVRVSRNLPSLAGVTVAEIGVAGAEVWGFDRLAAFSWCPVRTP